jgi:hypothetical protein
LLQFSGAIDEAMLFDRCPDDASVAAIFSGFDDIAGCSADFPYLPPPGAPVGEYTACYNDEAYALAGAGPCGSWCARSDEDWLVLQTLWIQADGSVCGQRC